MSTWLPAGSAAAARRVTGSCGDFTLDGVKFRVVCRGNLEIGLESDTQVGIDNISFRIKTTYCIIVIVITNFTNEVALIEVRPEVADINLLSSSQQIVSSCLQGRKRIYRFLLLMAIVRTLLDFMSQSSRSIF